MMTAIMHALPTLLAQIQPSLPQTADYMRILPELVLSLFGMLIMVVDPLLDHESSHQSLGMIALIGTLSALVSTFFMARMRRAGRVTARPVTVAIADARGACGHVNQGRG